MYNVQRVTSTFMYFTTQLRQIMRIGVYQSAGGGLDPQQRLQRLHTAVQKEVESTQQELDLVICPELFACGYNVGDQLRTLSQSQTGPITEQFSELAQSLNSAILFGYAENHDNSLYNSAMCISAQGEILANHRKRLNSPSSFEGDYFTESKQRTLFTLHDIKISIMICYEVEFPESVRHAACDGAQLIVVPTALVAQWEVVADCVVPSRAFENGVWLAYANHAGHENNFEYLGHSKIIAPDGVIEASAQKDEILICANIDVQRVISAQKRLPYLDNFQNA